MERKSETIPCRHQGVPESKVRCMSCGYPRVVNVSIEEVSFWRCGNCTSINRIKKEEGEEGTKEKILISLV